MPPTGSGTAKGNAKSNEGTSGKNLGGSGGGPKGSNQGGMSPSLMNSKYPGMKGKKTKSYEASMENLAKVGTIMGGMLGGPVGSVIAGGYTAADALANGTNPISGALNPFSGYQGEVPASPAGFAENNEKTKMLSPADKLAQDRAKAKNKKQPLSKGFTLLAGAGGTLLGS
jgi:hypothetical protein